MGNIFDFFAAPPGNVIYHFVLIFAIVAGVQAVWVRKPRLEDIHVRRLLLALALLIAGQLLLFLFSLVGWLGVINPRYILPPLDRLITLLSLFCIFWVWMFYRQPQRITDGGVLLLSLVAFIFFIITIIFWRNTAPVYTFNFIPLEITWSLLGIVAAIAGGVLVVLRRSQDWGVGLAIAVLYLAGFVVHLIWGSPNLDYAGAVRMAQMCAFVLLPVLARRLQMAEVVDAAVQSVAVVQPQQVDIPIRYSAEAPTIYTWLHATLPDDPSRVYTAIAHAIAQTMMADICYLIPVPEADDQVHISYGYDLHHSRDLLPFSVERERVPNIVEALSKGHPLEMDAHVPDMACLLEIIGVDAQGSLLVPLNTSQEIWGGALLLSPYSGRTWNQIDQNYLSLISGIIVKILQYPDDLTGRMAQIAPNGGETERKALKAGVSPETVSFNLEDLLSEQKALSEENSLLKAEIEKLRDEQQSPVAFQLSEEESGFASSLERHLRHPLASMRGHSELLLSETIGVLSSLQRSSLERIRSLIKHVTMLVENTKAGLGIPPEEVFKFEIGDMSAVFDEVIADTATQLRQKSINLRIDVPHEIPSPQIDQEVLKQILVQLLQNASSVTPSKGSIGIRAREEGEGENRQLVIQVTDTGGGIDPKNHKQLFSPPATGKALRIPGVGSLNSLYFARTLVEAYGGKIEVESARGQSTTIRVLLPLSIE